MCGNSRDPSTRARYTAGPDASRAASFPRCSEYRGERGIARYACAPGSGLCQEWATRTLSTDAATPYGVRGPDGDVQVFYMVDTNWDFQRQADEFRRLRAGACRP